MEFHQNESGENKGRRFGLEILNKSAIVLLSAYWEAYCEDIAAEGLNHLVTHLKDPQKLPEALRKVVSKQLKESANNLAVWEIAGAGWKARHFLGVLL